MEENKTTRVNRNVNYYSDRPKYDQYSEKHNYHYERPEYDHCPEKPEYDYYPERPKYDHYPVKPEYDHCPERPKHDNYQERPKYDYYEERPKRDYYDERPKRDYYEERPKRDYYDERPKRDYYEERPKHDDYDEKSKHDDYDEKSKHDCHDDKHKHDCHDDKCKHDCHDDKCKHDCHDDKHKHDRHDDKCKHDCHDEKHNHDCHDDKHNHDCHDDKHNHDCHSGKNRPNCLCCPGKSGLTSNGCTNCCEPLDIHCPDIHCAVCTPILADKIRAFACANQSIPQSNDALFTIDNPPPGGFPPGSRVCINKFAVRFTCAGITTDPLPINICSFTGSLPSRTSPACSASLFNSYEGTITSNFICNAKGTCATFAHNNLSASLIGAQYIVEGFVGCVPFTARTIVFGPRNYTGINIFGSICLPKNNDELTLRANFEFRFLVKQITPLDTGILAGGTTFDATILDLLKINERLFSIRQEELVVYSSPDGFKQREK